MRIKAFVCAAVAGACLTTGAQGAISYAAAGGTYFQSFDTLPNSPENISLGNSPTGWINDSTTPAANQFSIPGWYLFHSLTQTEGGANGNQRFRIGAGSNNTGAFWSYGASGSTERALGNIGSNSLMATGGQIVYGARFTNDTGVTLEEFTLDYTVEQWRDGGQSSVGSREQSVTFGYKVTSGAANVQDTGITNVAALGFTSPTFGSTVFIALDGNSSANQVVKGPVTVTGLNWGPGQDLWIRWSDPDHASNDHGLAIDDLSFSAAPAAAAPEPAGFALMLGVAALGLTRRRRTA